VSRSDKELRAVDLYHARQGESLTADDIRNMLKELVAPPE
jgi:hypothetical protein